MRMDLEVGMAYNAVPTAATGNLWTAAQHNVYVRGNFAAGLPDQFTAKGQLAAATGANAMAALSVGANGAYLQANSGETSGMLWGAHFGAGATDETYQEAGMNPSKWYKKAYDVENWDTWGVSAALTVGASDSYFTAMVSGYYLVIATMYTYRSASSWDAGTILQWGVQVAVTASASGAAMMTIQASGLKTFYMQFCDILYATAGQQIRAAFAYQGASTSTSMPPYGIFQVAWLGS